MTMIKVPLVQEHRPVESATEERMWDALYMARTSVASNVAADLENALFRIHQPMVRSIAQATVAESAGDRQQAEATAELALAYAVRNWRSRTGHGFRSYAHTAVLQRLNGEIDQPLSA